MEHNAKVYLAARNQQSAEAAIATLKEITGKEGIFLPLDLADLSSVKRAADLFYEQETELHILYNNA